MFISRSFWFGACLLSLFAIASSGFAETPVEDAVESPSAADQIKGDWVQYRDTANGRYMMIKQHLGDRTILTTYDPNKVAIYSHQSDYVVDDAGDIPVFRYKNKVVRIGPNAGAEDAREHAYHFRVVDDKFYELHGMLPDAEHPPRMTVWERLKVHPIENPAESLQRGK
ncbi:hypothetical protein [Roseimaritima ulvae]|uniref:YHS domain protein n=1 Tax=Roseimaritima ulvae TaxID=980254 RepID=A0A5B9QR83_9BACT|nr:hypothetical protein [Roseimaritima ulvae]QEG39556.1 hypothetical protein UC8_15510 [Roseimaritima ulvae]